MISSTPSSTASSDSSRWWYFWRIRSIRAGLRRGSRLMRGGLSETLRSLKPGRPRQRLAGERAAVAGRHGRGGDAGRIARLGRPAGVRREEADGQEEGRVGRGEVVDQLRGPARHEVGGVEVRVAVAAVGLEPPVLVDRVAPVAVGLAPGGGVPLVPAGRHLGRVHVAVAVQELAEVGGPVAGRLQPERQPARGVEPVVAAERQRVREHAVVVGVLAREEGRARRAAARIADEAVRERHALGADQLTRPGHRPHRIGGLVVGHQNDHVRLLRRGDDGRSCKDQASSIAARAATPSRKRCCAEQ